MKGILTKLSTNENDLRTETVEGNFPRLPTIGDSFSIYSMPLDPNMDFRHVVTSLVQYVDKLNEHTYVFKTLNSTYQIEVQE